MTANLLLPVVRHHLVVLQVIVAGSEVELVELQPEAKLLRGGFQNPHAFRDNFPADSIAGNYSNFISPIRVFLTGIGHCQSAFLVSRFTSPRNYKTHDDDRDRRHYQRTADKVESASKVSDGPLSRANHVRSSEAAQRAERIDQSDRRGGSSPGKEGRREAPKRRLSRANAEGGKRQSGDGEKSRRARASSQSHSGSADQA